MSTPITLDEFKKRLAFHDWHYAFSDDHGVYCAGEAEGSRLFHIASSNGIEFKAAYNDAYKKIYFNENFYKAGETFRPPFNVF